MFMFVNEKGQVAVAKSPTVRRVIFYMDDLSGSFLALVTNIKITPKPIVSVSGTIGGANYLNVFGEDPLEIQIAGVAVGYNCQSLSDAQSAIGNSVDFYKNNSVINRIEPIRFSLAGTGGSERQAFMIAMDVMQDNAFADMAKFTMVLLAEDLNNRRFDQSGFVIPKSTPDTAIPDNTGRPGEWVAQNPSQVDEQLALSSSLVTPAGNVTNRTIVNLSGNGLTQTSSNIR